jgi:polyisoprenoid-binding protein YceI
MHLNHFLLATLAACAALPAAAQQKLVPAQSAIVFVSKQMGVPVEGRFRKFDAQVAFDPAKPQASRIEFTIDTGSAGIGVPDVDLELPKPLWFGVARFPQASFQSTAIKAVGNGRFDISGRLTIKGRSQDVTVPTTLTQSGPTTTATGSFTIRRLAFAIGEQQWTDTDLVADEVQVRLRLTLTGVGKL